jgi:voltage-gated potassium channel
MFLTTLAFLVALGIILPFGLDYAATPGIAWCRWILVALYPLFLIEAGIHWATRSPRWRQHLVYCLVPPLRLAARDAVTGTRVWLPVRGWVVVDRQLELQVARTFSLPMVLLALAMVPLLAVEFFWRSWVENSPAIAAIVHYGTAVIWAAFTVEFIVMIAIVRKRLKYCREHWIDIVIILAPVLAFARLLRLSRLLRVHTLLRTMRVYRVRGLANRAYRAVVLFGILRDLLPVKPEKRLARLEEQLAEKMEEMRSIEEEIARLQAQIAARNRQKMQREQANRPASQQDHDRVSQPAGGGARSGGERRDGEGLSGKAEKTP